MTSRTRFELAMSVSMSGLDQLDLRVLCSTWWEFDAQNAQSVSPSAHQGLSAHQGSFNHRSYESNKSNESNLCICQLVAQTRRMCAIGRKVSNSGSRQSNGHILASIGRMELVLSTLDRTGQGLSVTGFGCRETRSSHELCHFEVGQ